MMQFIENMIQTVVELESVEDMISVEHIEIMIHQYRVCIIKHIRV